MLAQELISDIVPALKTSDTGMDAINWMEAFRVSHLPIVNNRFFLGLISDTDIYDLNSADEPLGNHPLSLMKPYVHSHRHIYDIIEVISRLKLTLLPVLNCENEYLGVITQSDLMQCFGKLIAAGTPGGILQIEVGYRDYALSEIARIVENADAKILSLYAGQNDLTASLTLTLKLNITALSPVVAAFERYGYRVSVVHSADASIDETVRRNYESLLMFMNV
ncbi:MAG: CBS domain-containing protein [Cytophagaceae bacterium]|jgi:signal-transduction protein with cAMP-binding, CBS, and nucleotidyltransferase domain|nr:CBS domain-containing protein [Cytophagaceae bacterium]